ncbi:MAG: DUF2339 domain-containing protein [Phycisphaerales bacterium]
MNNEFQQDLLARLDDLAKRVGNIERRLDEIAPAKIEIESIPDTSPVASILDDSLIEKPAPESKPVFEPAKLVTDINVDAAHGVKASAPEFLSLAYKRERLAQFSQRQHEFQRDETNESSAELRSQSHFESASFREASDSLELERWIGARWYAGAGALIVVVGIGLFIKLAFDRGWFHIAPAFRCLLGVAFGGGLILLAEIVRKKVAPLGAVGLYAAGLGSIFASTYAAYRMYALLDAPIAFGLLAIVAIFGIMIAVRAKLPSVAILSLIAGFVTPYLFFDAPPRPFVLPAYTLALLAVGLGITAWQGAGYRVLRSVAWWGTIINGSVWLIRSKPEFAIAALTFLSLVWLFVHAELAWSAHRKQLSVPAGLNLLSNARDVYLWRPLLSSFSTSAWALAFAIYVIHSWQVIPSWLAPGALMAATACLAGGLAGFPRPFIEKPTTDIERFAACLVLQSVGALIATVTLAFTGVYEVIAWGVLSLSVLVGAKWLSAKPFYIFSLISLSIATARLVLYDSMNGSIAANPVHTLGLNLSVWTICMVCCAALWWIAARFVADEPKFAARKLTPATLAGIGCLVMMGSIAIGAKAQSLAYAWMVFAVAFASVDMVEKRLGVLVHAMIAALLGTISIFVAFPWLDWSQTRSLLHPGVLAGLASVGTFTYIAFLARRSPRRKMYTYVAAAISVVVLFIVTSLDVARLAERVSVDSTAQRSALSIWWALFAVAFIIVGFWRRLAVVRQIGLILLGIAAAKALFLDLAGVPQTWRVASFLGIGLLMIGVGVVYSKASTKLKKHRTDIDLLNQ